MKVKYIGPSIGVDLLGPDNTTVRVMRNHSIEVPDDYGKRLVLQAVWSGGDKDETAELALLAAIPDLSPRAAAALVAAGYDDTGKLAAATDDELNGVEGVGPASVTAIRAAVPVETGDE